MGTYPVIFTIGLSLVTIILYLKGKLNVAGIIDDYQPKANPDVKAVKPQRELKAKQVNEGAIVQGKRISENKKHLKAV